MTDKLTPSSEANVKLSVGTPDLLQPDQVEFQKRASQARLEAQTAVVRMALEAETATIADKIEMRRKIFATQMVNDGLNELSTEVEVAMDRQSEYNSRLYAKIDDAQDKMMVAISNKKKELERQVEMKIITHEEFEFNLNLFTERRHAEYKGKQKRANTAIDSVDSLYDSGMNRLESAKRILGKE